MKTHKCPQNNEMLNNTKIGGSNSKSKNTRIRKINCYQKHGRKRKKHAGDVRKRVGNVLESRGKPDIYL